MARFILDNGEFHCCPILAKARLNPLNNTSLNTIPRVELNAAKLSIILHHILKEELEYKVDKEFFGLIDQLFLNTSIMLVKDLRVLLLTEFL